MQPKIVTWAVVLCIIIFLTGAADASRVAIVITQPQGDTYTKCLSVDQSLNAYEILKYTGQDITWSSPGPWGHGLCAISGTGCPEKNCFCDPENSWRFYLKQWSSDSWTASMKSFDGGSNCDEHYCAQEGDVIGLAYGPDGTEPVPYKYAEICQPVTSSGSRDSQDSSDKTTTTKEVTTTSISPASTTTEAPTTTTQEEVTTTTRAVTTTTQKKATTTTEEPTTTLAPEATTTPTTTEAPTTTLAEEKAPSIIGNVIAYSVNNSPVIAAVAAMLAAAYISFGFYKKKTGYKNA